MVLAATVMLDELFFVLLLLDFFGLGAETGDVTVGELEAATFLNEDLNRFLVDPLLTQSVR